MKAKAKKITKRNPYGNIRVADGFHKRVVKNKVKYDRKSKRNKYAYA